MSDTNIANETVRNATGKRWEEWFAILDGERATVKKHREIAVWLEHNFNITGWWAQMVTVQYERERGLRRVHEKADGFEAGKSKTFHIPVDRLYKAWIDPDSRKQWLEHPEFVIRTSTKNKSIRITWPDGTNVEVYFNRKGDEKTQLSIQHNKLDKQANVAKRKAYWQKQLDHLNTYLNKEH